MMQGEDQPTDRVRLPKSLFGAFLPGNRSAVRLAITVMDIGAGNIFKVRGLLGVQEATVKYSVGHSPWDIL